MLHDLNTYLHKAIPDTKLTIRKYLDVKFEYLVRQQHFMVPNVFTVFGSVWIPLVFQSYCLKVKEMDDEEYSSIVSCHLNVFFPPVRGFLLSFHSYQQITFFQAIGEPLYRVSTGNYEYRLVLRCRQEARARFAKMRKDVLEKIELLDQKHGLWLLLFLFFLFSMYSL